MSTRRDKNKAAKRAKRTPPVSFEFDLYRHLFDPDLDKRDMGTQLMKFIGLSDIPRLMEGWVERNADGEPEIVLYTRCGAKYQTCDCTDDAHTENVSPFYGKCLVPRVAKVRANPYFLRTVDETWEDTYAKFYFRAPPLLQDTLRGMMQDPVDTHERWRIALAALEHDPNPSGLKELQEVFSRFGITPDTQVIVSTPQDHGIPGNTRIVYAANHEDEVEHD